MIAGDQALSILFKDKIDKIMSETDLDMEYSDEKVDTLYRLANKILTNYQPDSSPGTWGANELINFLENETGEMSHRILGSLYVSLCWYLVAEYDDGRDDNEPFHDMTITIRVPNVDQCRMML